MRVGFIGIGYMGRPMAARLLDTGFPLTVYNRTRDKALPLAKFGATVVDSPCEVAAQSDAVIAMLANSAAVQAVLGGPSGILAGAHQGLTLIDMSSTAPSVSEELSRQCAEGRVRMLDAPVAGTVRAAAEGSLVVMVGGDEAVFATHQDLLRTFAKQIFHMGPNGYGCRMKLVVNILLGLTSQALAEAMTFGAAQGLDRQRILDVLVTTPSSSAVVQRKGQAMVDRNFTPAAPLRLLDKDLGQALAVAHERGIPLPATATVHALYATGRALGMGELDFSAIYAVMAHLMGLEPVAK